jgi:hypothetical protein
MSSTLFAYDPYRQYPAKSGNIGRFDMGDFFLLMGWDIFEGEWQECFSISSLTLWICGTGDDDRLVPQISREENS